MKNLYTYVPFQVLLGVVLGILLPQSLFVVVSCILLFLVSLIVVYSFKRLSITNYCFLVCVVIFGVLVGKSSVYLTRDTNLKNHYLHQALKEQNVELLLNKQLRSNATKDVFEAEVLKIENKVVVGKVLVEIKKDSLSKLPLLEVGSVIKSNVFFKEIPKPISPYHFSYREYLHQKEIYKKVTIYQFKKIGVSETLLFKIQRYRNSIVSKVQASGLSLPTQGLLVAVLLGERQLLPQEVKDSFSKAGVMHLIAISGMHVGVLYLLLAKLLSFVKTYKNGKYVYAFLILVFLWLFAVFSGLSSSVIRCVTMFSFITLSKLKSNRVFVLEPIVTSMLLLLVLCPNFLFDVGFQLSYAAVVSIVVFYPVLKSRIPVKNVVLNYFIDVVLISIVAQLGVFPLIVYYFHQIPIHFLVANFFAVSLLPVLLYGGVIGVLNMIWFPTFQMYLTLLDLFVDFYLVVIDQLASWENFLVKDVFMTTSEVFLYFLFLTLLWDVSINFRPKKIIVCSGFIAIVLGVHFHSSNILTQKEELLIYKKYGDVVLSVKQKNTLSIYAKDTLFMGFLDEVKMFNYIQKTKKITVPQFKFKNIEYQILDANFVSYEKFSKRAVLIIDGNPKVNMERLVLKLEPKEMIFTANNYRNNVLKWKSTCKNLQVPFYDIYKNGAYLKN